MSDDSTMVGYVARLEEGDLPALAKRERLARLMELHPELYHGKYWILLKEPSTNKQPFGWEAYKNKPPDSEWLSGALPDPYNNDLDFGDLMRWFMNKDTAAFSMSSDPTSRALCSVWLRGGEKEEDYSDAVCEENSWDAARAAACDAILELEGEE